VLREVQIQSPSDFGMQCARISTCLLRLR
jgi:hypothetical protein